MNRSLLLALCALLATAMCAQAQNSTPPSSTTASPATAAAAAPRASDKPAEPFTSDTPDILRETQLGVNHPGYSGLVWWIPFEFWQKSAEERGVSPEKTEQAFGMLKNYTVVCIFAARIGSFGAFDFISADDIQKNVFLRDAAGQEYSYIKDPSQDAKNLAAMLKPILSAAIGKAGENMQLLFFPARTKDGAVIADALHKGQFSVVIKNILGDPETVYLWRLPLTSVSPPKYCPVGKERVNLNWEYCPWHGVPLNASSNH